MKTDFQAKNIQEIFNVSKSRYEYITSKIGITPGSVEVEGTGRSHLYSFKNLIQFGVAHTASKLGLNPRTVKALLNFFSNSIELEKIGLFNPEIAVRVSIRCLEVDDKKFFYLSGQSVPEQFQNKKYLSEDFLKIENLGENFLTAFKHFKNGQEVKPRKENIDPGIKLALKIIRIKDLEDSDGYITINLGKIKDRVLETIKMMK